MARTGTNRAERLRTAVDALPHATKVAMLRGMDKNPIIVGAYADSRLGGICPMLAAHRNGGRTNLASFARAWDCFTEARRPRLATRRELRSLRNYIEMSLLRQEQGDTSMAELADQIRAERSRRTGAESEPARATVDLPDPDPARIRVRHRRETGERHRARELRDRLRWAWLRPSRRYDEFKDLLAAAEEQLSEQRAADLLGDRGTSHLRQR
jgi:hypothetical protein